MKIMLLDSNSEHSANLQAALHKEGYSQLVHVTAGCDLLLQVKTHTPDILIINMESPDRDTLESIRIMNREMPRPIVFFAKQSDYDTTLSAINAGVSAYIVDDLPRHRLRSILNVAIARFQAYQQLKKELDECKQRLADRKDVDRAKGILMQRRHLNEEEAYQLLRKMAMDRNMRIGEAARNFITVIALLGDTP